MRLKLKIADRIFPTIIGASESGLVEHTFYYFTTSDNRELLKIIEASSAPFTLSCIASLANCLLTVGTIFRLNCKKLTIRASQLVQ